MCIRDSHEGGRVAVQVRRGLIEQHDRGGREEGAGEHEARALSRGEAEAVVPDGGAEGCLLYTSRCV